MDRKLEQNKELFEAAGAADPDWLQARRKQAWEIHRDLALPNRAAHRWRYTDPASLLPGERTMLRPAQARGAEDAGGLVPEPLSEALGESGVVVMDLAEAARREIPGVREHLTRIVRPDDSLLSALQAALWSGGLYVEVPAGVELSLPIEQNVDIAGTGLLLPRTLIVLGEGSRLSFVDTLGGGGDQTALLHRTVEVHLGEDSRLDYVSLQDAAAAAVIHTDTGLRLESGARLNYVFGATGGGTVKSDLVADLAGDGAEADIFGLIYGRGNQGFDHHTIQRLHGKDCRSQLDVRVVLDDRSRSAATGLLRIGHQGLRGQAFQENRNLLLSEQATAVSLPELEILTDEVQARHGATAGPVDPDLLYYLASRGLSEEEAIKMVVAGFFEPLIEKAASPTGRNRLREMLGARIEG